MPGVIIPGKIRFPLLGVGLASNLSVTVMVGNGFDLSAGLKTSTTRFIDFFSKSHASDEGPVGRLAGCIEKEGAR